MNCSLSLLLCTAIIFVAGCARPRQAHPCSDLDPTLAASSFVLVTAPPAGTRATNRLRVTGCSRTNESNVVWELRGRDGSVLASGHTSGGGLDGAAAFEFVAEFSVPVPEFALLEVYALDESGGEGYPAPRMIIPLVLAP